jgi:DDB1- and CUL4-associated factor 13
VLYAADLTHGELWGWKGKFAYQWSCQPLYNSALLKLNKGTALSSVLPKTALNSRFDFHPMTISQYLSDAHLEELPFMVSGVLFNPAVEQQILPA